MFVCFDGLCSKYNPQTPTAAANAASRDCPLRMARAEAMIEMWDPAVVSALIMFTLWMAVDGVPTKWHSNG